MKRASHESAGKGLARAVSVIGLALVWVIVWANLPSRNEWFSQQSKPPVPAPELDLTIPGVSSIFPPSNRSSDRTMGNSAGEQDDGVSRGSGLAGRSKAAAVRARQVAEVKCEAEVQGLCPETLREEERRQCVERRVNDVASSCQQIVRQRIVRWKEAEGYKLACFDDLKRLCSLVQPGDGRLLQCLQQHAQNVSDRCFQSLPKGQLLRR
jgi:hypothetical protein